MIGRSRLLFSVLATAVLASAASGQEFPDLKSWKPILSFRPSAAVQKSVREHGKDWATHRIEDASGKLNLDYYPVTIHKLPSIDGELKPDGLLSRIRLNLNEFIDDGIARFEVSEAERNLFESEKPDGAVVHIRMKTFGGMLNPDDGCVVVSSKTKSEWRFSKIRGGPSIGAPFDSKNACAHPVSGNRAFGYVEGSGAKLTFYTIGADRPKSRLDAAIEDLVVFPAADKLWTSFQEKLATFVNDHGGKAEVGKKSVRQFQWDEVQKSKYFETADQPSWE